jgi:gamma-glutamyl phosphate reductase
MDCTQIFEEVLEASRKLNLLEAEKINKILNDVADSAEKNCEYILAENLKIYPEWIKLIQNMTDLNLVKKESKVLLQILGM